MENQLDNTSISFRNPTGSSLFFILGTGLVVLFLIGIVLAIINANWQFALNFAISLVGLLIFVTVAVIKISRLNSLLNQNRIEWSTAMPDIQRQSLNIEVRELSKILQVESEQISDLQSAYIVAEDLALRQIQHEERVPLLRHVSVASIPFDAVFLKNGRLVCCEVLFLVAPELRQERIAAMLRKITETKFVIEKSNEEIAVRLMIILVTQMTDEDDDLLRSALNKQHFIGTPVVIDIRLLDFVSLQRMYVTAENS